MQEFKKTYVFDIDGTICTQITDGIYSKALPLIERIEKVNKLYDEGHKIIFLTARGMGRFKGDVNLVYNVFYDFTFEQLKSWNVKFHELILGKPSSDYYIDDKGKNADEFFK